MEAKSDSGTAPSNAEIVVIAPRSSGIIPAANRPNKDFRKVYEVGSLPPPDIVPDGFADDAAEVLDGLTLDSNIAERERAKAWMRTACFHAKNEEYWRDRANQEFARAERVLGNGSGQRGFYHVAFWAVGASMYDMRWLIAASLLFFFAVLMDRKSQRELR